MSAGAPAGPPKSLLVVRLGAMGDVIHTMYAVAGLRQKFPDTQIGWVIEERWVDLLYAQGSTRSGARSACRPLVDFVHLVNTKNWRKSPLASPTRRQLSSVLREIRDHKYDLAIDFQGAIKSALLARLCGAGIVFGMDRPRETPARWFYAQHVRVDGTHVIERYCSLAEAVIGSQISLDQTRRHSLGQVSEGDGATRGIPAFDFPHDTAAEEAIAGKLNNVSSPIVLINPGAGWGAKQWPPKRYGEVCRELAETGAHTLVNYGPGEVHLAKGVQDASAGAAQPITCSLAELVALTRRLSLFIGGDTGPLHLAAAMGIPVVAIFGPTDPARNGPWSQRSIVLRNPASRNSLSHTSVPDPGLLQITPDQVLAAAGTLLETNHG